MVDSFLVGVRDVCECIGSLVAWGYHFGAGQVSNEDLLPYIAGVGCCRIIWWDVLDRCLYCPYEVAGLGVNGA